MTDVKSLRLDPAERSVPLGLEQDVYRLIAAGHTSLQHRDGKPNLARIAREAGLKRQRLSDPTPTLTTMGALIQCYMRLHGATKKQALAALLDVPDEVKAA